MAYYFILITKSIFKIINHQKKTLFHFVVHEHQSSKWHHDLRLELGGILKSWAVPKGMEINAGEKRLGILVEDHEINYQFFEGKIPKGEYGAGTVKIWDNGTYQLKNGGHNNVTKNEQEKK